MDMLSPMQSKAPWPNSPAERGKYYGLADPVWHGHQLVVMSNDTWLDFGTLVEGQKRKIKELAKANDEYAATSAVLVARVKELEDRLEATRKARKKEKLRWLGLGPKDEENAD